MDTRAFKPLYDGDGPWTSVYLPTSRDETDAAHRIGLEWRGLRERLAEQGAPDADLRVIDQVAGADRGIDKPSGQAVFANGGSVVLHRELSAPPIARATFADLPDALPLLAQTPDLGAYLLVLAGRQEAVIELHPPGRRDTGGPRKATRTWRASARDVASRVRELANAYDVDLIEVGGDVRTRGPLLHHLGALGRSRGVELPTAGFPPGADAMHAHQEAERLAARREYDWRASVLDRYRQGLANGTAVSGLDAVVEALRSGEAATLLLRHDAAEAQAPVWWGPEPGQLTLHPKELEGTRAPRIKRGPAADVLIRALIQTDGELLLCAGSEPGPEEFVGAILRRG